MQLKKIKYILIILIFPYSLFGQNDFFKQKFDSIWAKLNDTLFIQLLNENELKLKIPDDFEITDVVKNYDVFYQYAIKHQKSDFEIRYYIQYTDYNAIDTSKIKRDNISYSLFTILTMNASGSNWSNVPEIKEMPISNFDFTWEAYSGFYTKPEFGKDFNYCEIYARRLKSSQMLYYFMMFNDYQAEKYLVEKALRTIKKKTNP